MVVVMKKENLEKSIRVLEEEIEIFRTSGESDPEIGAACEEFLKTTHNLRSIVNKIQDLEFQKTMMVDISEEDSEVGVKLPKISANYKNYQTKRKLAASIHALEQMIVSPEELLNSLKVEAPVKTRVEKNSYEEAITLPKIDQTTQIEAISDDYVDFATAPIPIVGKSENTPIKAISKNRRLIRPIILKPLNQQKFAEQREKEFFTSAIKCLTDSEIESGLISNAQFEDLDIVPFAKEVTTSDIESALNTAEIVLPFVNKDKEASKSLKELSKYVDLEDEEIYSKHLEEIKSAA